MSHPNTKKNTVSFRYKFLHCFNDKTYLFMNLRTGLAEDFVETKRTGNIISYNGKQFKRTRKYNTYNLQAPDYYVNLEDVTNNLRNDLSMMGIV